MTTATRFDPPRARTRRCRTCKGTGREHKPIPAGEFAVAAMTTCHDCRGTGRDQGRRER